MNIIKEQSLTKRIKALETTLTSLYDNLKQIDNNFKLTSEALQNHAASLKAITELLNDVKTVEAMVGRLNKSGTEAETLTTETKE